MFRRKSRTEQLQDQARTPAQAAAERAAALRDRVVPAADAARHKASEKASAAVENLAPKVDTARDKLVEDVLPRVAETIATVAAGAVAAKNTASETADRAPDAFSVLRGEATAKKSRRKGRRGAKVLILVGLAAAAAAAAAVFKKSAPQEDPWATPVNEPYVPPSTGRDSSLDADDTSASMGAGWSEPDSSSSPVDGTAASATGRGEGQADDAVTKADAPVNEVPKRTAKQASPRSTAKRATKTAEPKADSDGAPAGAAKSEGSKPTD